MCAALLTRATHEVKRMTYCGVVFPRTEGKKERQAALRRDRRLRNAT